MPSMTTAGRGHMANQRARSVSNPPRQETFGVDSRRAATTVWQSSYRESTTAREADLERHCVGEERVRNCGSPGTSRDQAAFDHQAADDFRGIGAGGSGPLSRVRADVSKNDVRLVVACAFSRLMYVRRRPLGAASERSGWSPDASMFR